MHISPLILRRALLFKLKTNYMIENENQYQITLSRKKDFMDALSSLPIEVKDPILRELITNNFKGTIEELEDELTEWEGKNLPNTRELTQFDLHESMDRCMLMSSMMQDFLLKAPAIKSNPPWEHKIEMAVNLIEQVYQSIQEGL